MTGSSHTISVTENLAQHGYWPAVAARYLAEGKHSRAVQICRDNLSETPGLLSGRLIYARALYQAGQEDSAQEQFHRVLARDPDNVVALKYLGDIRFAAGDSPAAFSYYRRVLQVDPCNQGLCSEVRTRVREVTRTVTLRSGPEPKPEKTSNFSRGIPFYTETIGDLYLQQGHTRLASEVYRHLFERTGNPRLGEKLTQAEEGSRRKEH